MTLCLTLLLVFSLACVVFSLLSAFFGNRNFVALNGKIRYSPLSYFPFELYEGRSADAMMGKVFLYLYIGFASLLSCLGFFLCSIATFHGYLSMAIVYAVFSLLELALSLFLCLVPAYNFRKHILFFLGYVGISMVRLVFMGLAAMNFSKAMVGQGTLPMVFAIFFFVLALLAALLFVNPRLSKWTKMNSTMNEDGSTYTSRPKPFVLAASEWAVFLLNALGGFCYALMLVLCLSIVIG